jgi:hypothetical protein
MQEKSQNLSGKKEKNQRFERKCPVLMAAWLYPT